MATFASGVILALILLACAILLRNTPAQPGDTPRRNKQFLVFTLIAASLVTLVVTLATPIAHVVPRSVVAFVERIMPTEPALHHPFKFRPTAENRLLGP